LGSAEDSGGTGEAWVQSLRQKGSQVHASSALSRTVVTLAVIPEAARVDRLGVRFLLSPDHHVSDAVAIAERWVRSVRSECLDHVFIFNERHLEKVLAEYIGYFNHWRPHRSIGQRAPCAPATDVSHRSAQAGKIIAIPVLGSLHHVYQPTPVSSHAKRRRLEMAMVCV
jgi:hypothetical protein